MVGLEWKSLQRRQSQPEVGSAAGLSADAIIRIEIVDSPPLRIEVSPAPDPPTSDNIPGKSHRPDSLLVAVLVSRSVSGGLARLSELLGRLEQSPTAIADHAFPRTRGVAGI